MCKSVKIFIGSKKTCLGVIDTRERDKDIETGLKEGGGIEILTTVLHSRAAPSLCIYLPGPSVVMSEILKPNCNKRFLKSLGVSNGCLSSLLVEVFEVSESVLLLL